MTGICVCCGRNGSVQQHHPGRRDWTGITVPVCQDCHTILTIWDGGKHGQRTWQPGTEPLIRVKAGIADILNLASLRSAWFDIAGDAEQILKELSPSFTVRYSASDTAYEINQIIPDNRKQQITEVGAMMGAYQVCLRPKN